MTEKQYVDATDLGKIKAAIQVMQDCMCFEDPDKTRKAGILQNLELIKENLERKTKIDKFEDGASNNVATKTHKPLTHVTSTYVVRDDINKNFRKKK
jgi:hypothetical protein